MHCRRAIQISTQLRGLIFKIEYLVMSTVFPLISASDKRRPLKSTVPFTLRSKYVPPSNERLPNKSSL